MTDPMIAYCGVNCAPCPDFVSGRCPGCRQTRWDGGEVCMPVRCCRARQIESCGDCETFPCAEMADFYEESPSHKEAFLRLKAQREE